MLLNFTNIINYVKLRGKVSKTTWQLYERKFWVTTSTPEFLCGQIIHKLGNKFSTCSEQHRKLFHPFLPLKAYLRLLLFSELEQPCYSRAPKLQMQRSHLTLHRDCAIQHRAPPSCHHRSKIKQLHRLPRMLSDCINGHRMEMDSQNYYLLSSPIKQGDWFPARTKYV